MPDLAAYRFTATHEWVHLEGALVKFACLVGVAALLFGKSEGGENIRIVRLVLRSFA